MRVYLGLPFLVACTGENVLEKQENSAPTVLIVSHSDGASVQDGYIENFRATVADDDDSFIDLSIAWYVGEDLVCDWTQSSPAGDATCEIVFTEGDTNVIVEVRDPQGAGGRAELAVEVMPTEAPLVEMLSPLGSGSYYSDQLVQFSALVSDSEDASEDLIISWTSSLDGELVLDTAVNSNGEISDYTYLSEGNHAIELRVEDTSGKFSNEEVVVQVGAENNVPTCSITSPEENAAVVVGDLVVFRGEAGDADIPATDLSIEWVSDKDGVFGTATASTDGRVTLSYDALSTNGHTISMNVRDEVDALCSAQIFMTVGTPPIAIIDEPLDGEVYSVGETVTFRGTVSDTEDHSNSIAVEWVSDMEGILSTGNANSQGISQFTSSTLGAGVHSVSFTATDTSGLVADDLISFRVNTPPEVDSLILAPDPAYSTANLVVTATMSDNDGQNPTATYAWFEDGIQTSYTGTTISSSELDVGETWTVRVTPNDGYTDGSFIESSLTIENSLPSIATASITSTDAPNVYVDSVLTCSASGTDPDEIVSPTYLWNIGGSLFTGSSVDLSSYSLTVGDSIECVATVTDSQGATASSATQDVVDNRAPSVSSIQVVPSSPTSQEELECSATINDPDGDSYSTDYAWEIAGSNVGYTNVLNLANVGVSPTDVVECIVTVTDDHGDVGSLSQTVTIQNTDPTIDSIVMNPTEPTLQDTLTCSATVSDIDGGQPQTSFVLSNQTTGQILSPSSTTSSSVTVNLSQITANYLDVISCSVTATDIHGGSVSDSDDVTILNTAPVFDQAASIAPNSGVEMGSMLTCTSVASDPDDGVASLSYLWQVNGSQVSVGNTWTVNTVDANVGDQVICVAIATDFDGNSTTSTSSSVTVDNTIPEVSNVSLDTLIPITSDVISVSSTSFDSNGDSVTLNYEWHVVDASNGNQDLVVYSGSGTLFSSLDGQLYFDKDDEVYVRVTPNDGIDNGMTVESDHAFVQNSAPTTPIVALSSPSNPPMEAVDDLTCSITSTSSDADGDSIEYWPLQHLRP